MTTSVVPVRVYPPDRSPKADHGQYRLVVCLWFLYLFAPTKLITYYLPTARPVSWLPELLLWVCGIYWLRSPVKTRGYPAYTAFLCLMIIGTVVAYLIGNWGVSREILHRMYQFYALGLLTLTYCITPQRARSVLRIYFGYFLWYGLWGLVSLRVSPLTDEINPGARSIIYWHPDFDNRDAFGPLMVAGLAFSVSYFKGTRATKSLGQTASILSTIALCFLGFITSFGRGAFVGFLAAASSMWLRSRRKLATLTAAVAIVVSFYAFAPEFASRYFTSMHTITEEGVDAGTGADRKGLWNIAIREFLFSPIIGVGTGNYGIATQRVLAPDETYFGYTRGRLWGRSVHSTPMSFLSEYGIVGVVVAFLIVRDFFRSNWRIRLVATMQQTDHMNGKQAFPPGYLLALALGLHGAFLTFCISGIFYEILYTPLYWNVIVLNRMLYFASGADALTESTHGQLSRTV